MKFDALVGTSGGVPSPTTSPPLPPPMPVALPWLRRMGALLLWGFAVSIALHAILGPIVGRYRTPIAETEEVSVVSLSRRTTIKLPSPLPTPQPTQPPTPMPSPIVPPTPAFSALPIQHARPQAHLKISVYRATSAQKATSSEPNADARSGSEEGVPQGALASAPPGGSMVPGSASIALTAAPSPPTPAPTAPCAVPNAQAQATSVADLTYPESARENGATGEVDVLVTLSATGAATQITIYHTSGNGALDQAAMRAARASSYSPQIVNCQGVAGTYTFHASFSPRDSSR